VKDSLSSSIGRCKLMRSEESNQGLARADRRSGHKESACLSAGAPERRELDAAASLNVSPLLRHSSQEKGETLTSYEIR